MAIPMAKAIVWIFSGSCLPISTTNSHPIFVERYADIWEPVRIAKASSSPSSTPSRSADIIQPHG
jgi:hypothetical protein